MSEPDTTPRTGAFTLIEVVAAIGALALMMLGISFLQASTMRMDAMTQQLSKATSAAQAKIVEIEAQDPGTRVSGSDAADEIQRTWTLSAGPSANTSSLVMISSWTNIAGNVHQVSFSTILAN